MALVDRTAYPRLPRAVAARELAEVFTPTGEEVSWARAKTTTDQHCLTLLVLLKCYQRLGYFPRPEQIPAEIAEHVRGCAELTSTDSVIDYVASRRAKRYREFIREWAGVVWEPRRVRAVAESAMREALLGKDNPADVINVALEQLAQQRCELPAYSTLETDQNRGRSTFRAPGDPPEPPGADHPGTDHAPGGLRRTGCQGHHGRDYGCGKQR